MGQQVGERDPGGQGNGSQRAGSRCLGPGTWPGRLHLGAWALVGPARAREGLGSSGLGEARGSRGIARC